MDFAHYFSLDRIEGDLAVLIDDNRCSAMIALSDLPVDAREGMVYRKVGETYMRDPAEEERRREQIRVLHNRLRKQK